MVTFIHTKAGDLESVETGSIRKTDCIVSLSKEHQGK